MKKNDLKTALYLKKIDIIKLSQKLEVLRQANMEKNTAIYIRVSTTEQNIDMQADALRIYAERSGLNITHEYVEYGVSGKNSSRPQLNALLKEARSHAFKNVLVWKFDRFARSVSQLVKAMEEFNHLGVRFISIKDQIDMKSPMGKAMFVLVATMAELEGDPIRERVKEGMQAAKSRGKKIGRPSTPDYIIGIIQNLASKTDLSINQIRAKIDQKVSRAVIGKIVQKARKGRKQI